MTIVIWNLFDSGDGSYNNVLKDDERFTTFSIGIDKENKNDHFLNIDLANYQHYYFNNDEIINKLDKLPKPNIITASPPCESWSVASAMRQGNACWKQESPTSSRFTIRDYNDYSNYQFNPNKSLINRINGELTIYNTIRIIKHYKPNIYIIENPAHGRIWDYMERILNFKIEHENITYYNNYGFQIKKPTKFVSNINLNLDKTNKKAEKCFKKHTRGYNDRSSIPDELINKIIKECIKKLNNITKEK